MAKTVSWLWGGKRYKGSLIRETKTHKFARTHNGKIKKIKKPLAPTIPIKIEHKKGPPIAPIPNINCRLAPAATNFSLGIKSLV